MWAITLTYDGRPSEEELTRWDEVLDAAVAAIPDAQRWSVTLYEDGGDAIKAARSAADQVRKIVATAEPVAVEILDEDEHLNRADRPTVPEIVSAVEAADMLGISRQRVHQLSKDHATFPAPLYTLRTGPLWTRDAIAWFDSTWERKPGRPAKTPGAA